MILYNITFRDDDTTTLIPIVPYTAAEDEDKSTKRVCFADTVPHCIEAIGPCSRDLHIGSIFRIRSVNTAHLDNNSILTPEELFKTSKVPDALQNREYWYLKEVSITLHKVRVVDFSYEHAIAWKCVKYSDVEEIVRILKIPYQKHADAESLYNYANHYLNDKLEFDKMDDLWDSIAELLFAQRIALTKLKLEYLF